MKLTLSTTIIVFAVFIVLSISSLSQLIPNYLLDSQPIFPNGKDSLENYFKQKFNEVKSPSIDFEGYITVLFSIDTLGKTNVILVNANNHEIKLYTEYFKAIFRSMPLWNPGIINNKKVYTLMSYPFIIKKN